MGMRHVALLLFSAVRMVGWGRDGVDSGVPRWFGARSRVQAVVDDYVREVVEEAKGVRVIYTDGVFDDGIRREAKRRGIELEPISVMKGDIDSLRKAVTNGEDVALQLGFEHWKRAGKELPLCSGVLARTGKMSETDRQRGIKVTERLGERILELYENGVVTTVSDKELIKRFYIVQWRIARIARMRAERDGRAGNANLATRAMNLSDRLDHANPALNKFLQDLDKARERIIRTVTPRESLQLALARADFTMARQYAQKVLQTDPDYSPANFAMGLSYLEEKQYSKAASYFRRCVDKNPNDVSSWNNLAVGYQRQGLLDEALAAAERAMEAAKVLKTPEVRERAIKEVDRTLRHIQKSREKKTGKLFLPVGLSERVASRS